jgi:ATP-dependent protease Clp ATPase subunit
MKKIKADKCSFCGRKAEKVPLLIASKDAAICSNCILSATQELFRILAEIKGSIAVRAPEKVKRTQKGTD